MIYKRNRHFCWKVHLCQDCLNDSCDEGSAIETSLVFRDWNELVHQRFVLNDVVCIEQENWHKLVMDIEKGSESQVDGDTKKANIKDVKRKFLEQVK